MGTKDIKWCPQHGYPLPCAKCGMPISKEQRNDIYKAGIKEVVYWLRDNNCEPSWKGYDYKEKLKEWGIE